MNYFKGRSFLKNFALGAGVFGGLAHLASTNKIDESMIKKYKIG